MTCMSHASDRNEKYTSWPLLLDTMKLVDSVARAINRIYSPTDVIAEDFIKKHYFGLASITMMFPNIGNGGTMVIMLKLGLYLGVLLFHYVVIVRPLPQFFHCSIVLFGQALHYSILLTLLISLIILIQFKRREILSVHKALATNLFDYSEPYVCNTQKLQAEMRKERLYAVPVVVMGIVIVVCISLEKQINQYGNFNFNKTLNLTVNYNLPVPFGRYPYQTDEPIVYYVTALLQILMAISTALFIMIGGYVYMISAQNLCMQIKILQKSLKNLEKRSLKMLATEFGNHLKLSSEKLYANKSFSHCYKTCLKNNFQHHQEIIRVFNDWKSIFSVIVCACYVLGSIMIAFNLLAISSWRELPGSTLSSCALCLAEVGFLYMVSMFGQKLTDQSEELRFEMYSIKWYYCDEGVKRSIRIFLEVTKKPMILMAGGIIPTNMHTFAKVMNSSYSYYHLMNAFNVA